MYSSRPETGSHAHGRNRMRKPAQGAPRPAVALLLLGSLALCLHACSGSAARTPAPPPDMEAVGLPPPRIQTGGPLMQLLAQRRSIRDFDEDRKLPPQVLSDLLWAAWGVNRPETGKRTAPSAMNWQEIDVYVALEQGVYRYDPRDNRLLPVLAEDVRARTGRFIQPFVAGAPLNLVYVADLSRVSVTGKIAVSEEEKIIYAAATAGCIVQNVYLFCAAEGLGTVVRGLINKPALRSALGLKDHQKIILAQTVGYPAN